MTSPKFTPADAARLEEALAKTTSGPWCVQAPGDGNGHPVFWSVGEMMEDDPPIITTHEWQTEENARFVADARNSLLSLLAAYRGQEAEIGRLREALRPFALGDAHRKISGGVAVTVEESDLRCARAVLQEAAVND